MIEVTVRLDESAIQAAAEEAWKRMLSATEAGGRYGVQGEANKIVVQACHQHLAAMDLRPFIDAAMQRLIQSTVDEVVQEHLRAAAKKRLKSMPAADLLRLAGGEQS